MLTFDESEYDLLLCTNSNKRTLAMVLRILAVTITNLTGSDSFISAPGRVT